MNNLGNTANIQENMASKMKVAKEEDEERFKLEMEKEEKLIQLEKRKEVKAVLKPAGKNELAETVIELKRDKALLNGQLDEMTENTAFLREKIVRMEREQEEYRAKLEKDRADDLMEHEAESEELRSQLETASDDRINKLAEDMAEMKLLIKSFAPPSGLRANPYGMKGAESVSSTGSVQSSSAYVSTGETTTVSGVPCGIYERISNGRLFTWRDNLCEYKPISEAQFAKKFKNSCLAGGDNNEFNKTNMAGVDVDAITKAKTMSMSGNNDIWN